RLPHAAELLHITLESLEADDATPPRLTRREIDLLAGRNVVLTVHEGPVEALIRFRAEIDGETRLGDLSAGDLISSLVDEVLVGCFLLVEGIEREIDDLGQPALPAPAG